MTSALFSSCIFSLKAAGASIFSFCEVSFQIPFCQSKKKIVIFIKEALVHFFYVKVRVCGRILDTANGHQMYYKDGFSVFKDKPPHLLDIFLTFSECTYDRPNCKECTIT